MTDPNPQSRVKTPKLKVAAQDAYGHLKDAASESFGQTKERLQTVVADAGDEAQRRYGDLEAYVQLWPARALGLAAAAGLLAGLLLRGSSKTVYLRRQR